ncbi:hypothetical protein AUJ68_04920 [Candidatus Woesearchaeota archaeon CG1_02_57_44]|nr:MAG: hypothetical protein AUJ68_04920 [Candidatus Woesearchaeota archaeon CG1_02_57_44]PIN67793.1 MAG: hypothetical protein COV94_06725 [Candidatus Woesearchaeota archaeon CG11_big_fil_rev_8_21_14_0_20_57_5]
MAKDYTRGAPPRRLYRTSKLVLAVQPEAEAFLLRMTSNNAGAPRTAFLDRFGRIVATADHTLVPAAGRRGNEADAAYLVIERTAFQPLMLHLRPYLKLCRTRILPTGLRCYWMLGEKAAQGDAATQETGARTSISSGDITIPQREGALLITQRDLDQRAIVTDEEFLRFRLDNSIPLHLIDYTDEMLLNITDDPEEFYDAKKGCFPGQEILARVTNLAKPPRRLQVAVLAGLPAGSQAKATSTLDGRGFVLLPNA